MPLLSPVGINQGVHNYCGPQSWHEPSASRRCRSRRPRLRPPWSPGRVFPGFRNCPGCSRWAEKRSGSGSGSVAHRQGGFQRARLRLRRPASRKAAIAASGPRGGCPELAARYVSSSLERRPCARFILFECPRPLKLRSETRLNAVRETLLRRAKFRLESAA
jgi:hypothetical protein